MSIVYRASELGSCTNRLVLGRVGFEPAPTPEKYVEYFARGEATEVEVKEALLNRGWTIEREQEEVRLPISGEIVVVGHIDGVAITMGELNALNPEGNILYRVLEVKRMNDAYWNVVKNGGWYVDGLMEKYRWQVSVYMLSLGMECVLVCRNGDTGEDHYLYAEEPFHSLNEIAARVLVVEGRARSFSTVADLPPCDRNDYPCPFYQLHSGEDKDTLDGSEAEELEGIGVAYADAKARESRAKADGEVLRERAGRLLGKRSKARAGLVSVSKFTGSRTVLDEDAMRADGIDVEKYRGKRSNKKESVVIKVRDQ